MPKTLVIEKLKLDIEFFHQRMHRSYCKMPKSWCTNYGKSAKKKATGGVVKMKKGGEAKKPKI